MVTSEAIGCERQWQRRQYENKCASPAIVGECCILKIGDADRYVRAGVYPTHDGFEFHVQEVTVRGNVEHHVLMYSAVTSSDDEARRIAEVLARVAFVGVSR